ncbi:TPA: hypothetical protein ACGVW2_000365, partial [Enterococcus faecium]
NEKYEELFLFDHSYYLMQDSFFTTSDKRCSKACICGNKPNQIKNMRSCFSWLFLLLDAGQLFHDLR